MVPEIRCTTDGQTESDIQRWVPHLKIKKTKRYSEQLMPVLIMIFIQINSFKTKNKIKIFKLFTESLWNKVQSKKKRERNDENSLIGFLRGQFLDSKAKTGGIVLNIFEVL